MYVLWEIKYVNFFSLSIKWVYVLTRHVFYGVHQRRGCSFYLFSFPLLLSRFDSVSAPRLRVNLNAFRIWKCCQPPSGTERELIPDHNAPIEIQWRKHCEPSHNDERNAHFGVEAFFFGLFSLAALSAVPKKMSFKMIYYTISNSLIYVWKEGRNGTDRERIYLERRTHTHTHWGHWFLLCGAVSVLPIFCVPLLTLPLCVWKRGVHVLTSLSSFHFVSMGSEARKWYMEWSIKSKWLHA